MRSRPPGHGSRIGKRTGNSTPARSAIAFGASTILVLLVSVSPVHADDGDFAKTKKCMSCHAVDEKRVGPPFKAVAARYANDPAAEERLTGKIRNGGAGAWGVVPMPANDELSKADAQRLAHWVLGLK